jgi:hypothetical protein
MNPLGPHQLGAAFVGATDCIDIDIRVRIVLLKLFERSSWSIWARRMKTPTDCWPKGFLPTFAT